jgi:hypothetical protein
VPADATVLAGHELQCDESLLTGEALPVRKIVSPKAASPSRRVGTICRRCIPAASSSAATAEPRSSRPARRSEIGKIGLAITRIDTEPSRLRIPDTPPGSLSLSALAVFLYGFWRGGWLDALLSGIALGKRRLVPKSIQTIHSSTREQCYHKKTPPHRRRPVPIAEMVRAFAGKSKGGDAALNPLNASEH